MCREFIKRHINSIPPQEIFTTRHMLLYGERDAIDRALRSMVNTGYIVRLARGVFVQDLSVDLTIEEIVHAKLNAYRSTLSTSAETELHGMSLIPFGKPNTFAKNGSSSSFWTIKGRAYLQNICERKMTLCQSAVAQFIYMLWFLHNWKPRLLPYAIRVVGDKLGRAHKEIFWLASALMPAWLRKKSRHLFPRARVMIDNPFLRQLQPHVKHRRSS